MKSNRSSLVFRALFVIVGVVFVLNTNQVTCDTTIPTTVAPITTTTTTTESTTTLDNTVNKCIIGPGSTREQELLKDLSPIIGNQFKWSDKEHEYFFTVCGPSNISDNSNEGFVQRNIQSTKKFVLGRLNNVDLEGIVDGKEKFIRLKYRDGDKYAGSCGKTPRNSVVYIFCDTNAGENDFTMVEENNDRDDSQCTYIFKISSQKMCPFLKPDENTTPSPVTTPTNKPTADGSTLSPTLSTLTTRTNSSSSTSSSNSSKSSSTGVFTILLITVFSILCVYFIIGTLFMRFARQARGWEQIPNWRLWQALGNRSADCCNYICRCGQARAEPNAYENIIDHASDDENLLNM